MDELGLDIVLREFDPEDDQAFIYTTWRNGVYYSQKHLRQEDAKEVFKTLTAQIKETLKSANVRIACLEDTPSAIIGYCIFTDKHLDWVYVKEGFRNNGIATLLVPKDIESVTPTLTKVGQAILEKKLNRRIHGHAKEEE